MSAKGRPARDSGRARTIDSVPMDGPQPSRAVADAAAAPPVRSATRPWVRTRAVVQLCRLQQQVLLSVRIARGLGWLTSLGFVVALGLSFSASDSRNLSSIVIEALGWLSWVAGGPVALFLARNLHSLDTQSGLTALAMQRGHSPHALGWARTLATMQEVAMAVTRPGLMLGVLSLALSPSLAVAAGRSLLLLGVVGYSIAVGVLLGGLSRWSAATSPRHGPSLLTAIVIGPHLAQGVWPSVPSVPSWLGTCLDQMRWLGAIAG